MSEFEGVVPALQMALSKRGYENLTPVQKEVLAPELVKADALVSAQTGSGKTVAFGLAIAPTLLDGADRFGRADIPLALIIAPTRELAMQVKRELEWLFAETGASIASCVGGMDTRTERRTLDRGAHIVVGTPGRLRDHIQRGSLDLSNLRAAVLDEADEMLDLGFREDLEFILETAPETRRTLMFSATVPRSIAHLAKNYQRDAVRISTKGEQKQHVDIEYRALTIAPRDQENAIINVLRYYDAKNALVFCATRAMVNHMTARLNNRGFSVVALSGELSQNERTHALQAMRDQRARVCVATDVAARGIDLPGLELVVHAELPQNAETLLHRSGRTGRAGSKGVSALIVPKNQTKKAERLLGWAKIDAKWDKPPSARAVMEKDNARFLNEISQTESVKPDEKELVEKLVELHSLEQVATALVRLYRGRQSAPEELTEISHTPDPKRAPREEFANSVWVSLTVGRNQRAEPRWLLPLLCRVGDISKSDIGAIKMQPEETFVQLNAASADAFFDTLGPDGNLEDGITATRLQHVPKFSASPARGPKPGRSYGDKPRGDKPYKGKSGGAKPYKDKSAKWSPEDKKPKREKGAEDTAKVTKPYSAKKRIEGASDPSKPIGKPVHYKGSAGDAPRRADGKKARHVKGAKGAGPDGKAGFKKSGKPKPGFSKSGSKPPSRKRP